MHLVSPCNDIQFLLYHNIVSLRHRMISNLNVNNKKYMHSFYKYLRLSYFSEGSQVKLINYVGVQLYSLGILVSIHTSVCALTTDQRDSSWGMFVIMWKTGTEEREMVGIGRQDH